MGLMGSSELGREYGLLGFVSEELIIWRGGGHTRRDLYAVDFAPITELSGAVRCWAAGSTRPSVGITQPYLPLLSSSVACSVSGWTFREVCTNPSLLVCDL